MALAFVLALLVSFYGVSILNRERPLQAGELGKMLGAAFVFLLVIVVVLSVLMYGSSETDWAVILPIAAASYVGLLVGAGLGGALLSGRRSSN